MIDEKSHPFSLAGNKSNILACIGISCYPKEGINYMELIRRSDEAMYFAKNNGKNGYRFYLTN